MIQSCRSARVSSLLRCKALTSVLEWNFSPRSGKSKGLRVSVFLRSLKCSGLQLILLAVLLLSTFFLSASAESIVTFDVDAVVEPDSTVNVSETILYDHDGAPHTGLYRTIPVVYTRNGVDYDVELRFINATDDRDRPLSAEVVKSGRNVVIHIKEDQRFSRDIQMYRLHYVLRRGINFSDNSPEFFYKMIGTDNHLPIANASHCLLPPPEMDSHQLRTSINHRLSDGAVPIEPDVEVERIYFEAGPILPGQDLEVAVGFPSGTIHPPSGAHSLLWSFLDNWPAILIPITVVFGLVSLYWQCGPAATSSEELIVTAEPPLEVPPACIGTLVDESCDLEDIVATIVDLGARGHLQIVQLSRLDPLGQEEPALQFIKTEPSHGVENKPLSRFERLFMEALFGPESRDGKEVTLDEAKSRLAVSLPSIERSIYQDLVDAGLILGSHADVRNGFRAVAFAFVFMGVILIFFGTGTAGGLMNVLSKSLGLGLAVSGLALGAASQIMPIRSLSGCKLTRKALGWTTFLELSDEQFVDRSVDHSTEDRDKLTRELPYAMVLRVGDRWAEHYERLGYKLGERSDALEQAPNWFLPATGESSLAPVAQSYMTPASGFSPSEFTVELGRSLRAIESSIARQLVR